ncbi:MAG: NAD(P)-dependent oxidoreductase [Sarcina sp.]
MKTLLIEEANKCLSCKKPRCKSNCPIDTEIPEIIELYKVGDIEKAGKILFENNPLSVICAKICPHEEQCSGNCIKGIKGKPVEFHKIEYDISYEYLKNLKAQEIIKNKKRIGIIGSGPAGITIAIVLAKKGYDVTIFESRDSIGGVLRYGIPEFRLNRDILKFYENYLINLGVHIRFNTLVGPILTIDKLFKDGYLALFIGTGTWNARTLEIKGETLGNVIYAIDYLKNPKSFHLGQTVNVIGAGNVAMDAARSAKYFGASKVNVFFRDAAEKMEATKIEIQEAKEEGVDFNYFKTPIEIINEGTIFADVSVTNDNGGNINFEIIKGSESLYKADSTIIAIGQTPKNNIIKNTNGIDINSQGLIKTCEKGYTSRKGIFACGDVVTGPRKVVEAVRDAKKVASEIDSYCKGLK